MRRKSFFAPIVVFVSLCLFASIIISMSYQMMRDRMAVRNENLELAKYGEFFPDCGGFTLLEDVELLDGVEAVYTANDGSGYIVIERGIAITETHRILIAINSSGNIIGSELFDEPTAETQLISEDILNAFTSVQGNYNAKYYSQLLRSCIETAKDQILQEGVTQSE